MKRFFAKSENITVSQIYIDGSDVNHIKNVLRMKAGDEILASGGNNTDYICTIRGFEDSRAVLDIVSTKEADKELPARIYLFQGLPKADKLELIIQKCVELGVYEIIPVAMKRCVVKLDDKKAAAKVARWQAISEGAAKQSGRTIVPQIHSVMSFSEAVKYAAGLDMSMIPYELAEGMEATQRAVDQIKPGMSVGIFIGPEGGIDLNELDMAAAAGAVPVSLGKRILRTETAGLCIMSIIMYHLEIN